MYRVDYDTCVEIGYAYDGLDLATVTTATADACFDMCKGMMSCVTATWNHPLADDADNRDNRCELRGDPMSSRTQLNQAATWHRACVPR